MEGEYHLRYSDDGCVMKNKASHQRYALQELQILITKFFISRYFGRNRVARYQLLKVVPKVLLAGLN
jgi:hypothetical protein